MTILTWTFWRDALERAIKTAAQSAILGGGFTSSTVNGLELNWLAIGGFALGGFVLSVLSSVGSVALTGSASAISSTTAPDVAEPSDESVEADAADPDLDDDDIHQLLRTGPVVAVDASDYGKESDSL